MSQAVTQQQSITPAIETPRKAEQPVQDAPRETIAPPPIQSDGETTAAPADIHGGISQKQLADRLGVSREAVRRSVDRGAEHFASWSQAGNDDPRYRKNADPDGLQWERRSNGLFYPLPSGSAN